MSLRLSGELVLAVILGVASALAAQTSPLEPLTTGNLTHWVRFPGRQAISGARVFVKDAKTLALWTWTP